MKVFTVVLLIYSIQAVHVDPVSFKTRSVIGGDVGERCS